MGSPVNGKEKGSYFGNGSVLGSPLCINERLLEWRLPWGGFFP